MTDRNCKAHPATRGLAALGVGAVMILGARFLIDFFGSAVPYAMPDQNTAALDSEEFIQFLSLVTDGTRRHSRISRLKNGVEFFPAYLQAIRRAKDAINLEFYQFEEGRVGDEILAALTERAEAGVEVRIIVDALGSFGTRSAYFDRLAGCRRPDVLVSPDAVEYLAESKQPDPSQAADRRRRNRLYRRRWHRRPLVVRHLRAGMAGYRVLCGRGSGSRPDFRLLRKLARIVRTNSLRLKTVWLSLDP